MSKRCYNVKVHCYNLVCGLLVRKIDQFYSNFNSFDLSDNMFHRSAEIKHQTALNMFTTLFTPIFTDNNQLCDTMLAALRSKLLSVPHLYDYGYTFRVYKHFLLHSSL